MALRDQSRANYFDDRKLSDRVVVAINADVPIHRERFAPGGIYKRMVNNRRSPPMQTGATVRVNCTDSEVIDGTAGLACLCGYYYRLKDTV